MDDVGIGHSSRLFPHFHRDYYYYVFFKEERNSEVEFSHLWKDLGPNLGVAEDP